MAEPTCRVCGCTDLRACPGGCSWVEADLCSACAGAPLPYDWLAVAAGNAAGGFQLYLTDANGRKIAAVWGKRGEKEATAERIVRACNGHDGLVKALEKMRREVDMDMSLLNEIDEALAKARGDR